MIALSFGKSHRQDLAATKTAAGQHVAAVLGHHTGAETMHLAALTLFGLIRSEHNLSHSFTGPCLGQMYSLVIVHKTGGDVKHLPPFLKKTCAETAGTGPVRQKNGEAPRKKERFGVYSSSNSSGDHSFRQSANTMPCGYAAHGSTNRSGSHT